MKSRAIFITVFALFSLMTAHANNDKPVNENAVTNAQFIGGKTALQDYIKINLVYPSCAREKALEGVVRVSFFVLPDGSIYNAKVVKGMDKVCDKVALQVIKNMPHWTPATQNGQAAASKINMNITFRLEE